MPIRDEERERYPANWREISERIRFARAAGRCECKGECGRDHDHYTVAAILTMPRDLARPERRCTAQHGHPHPVTGSTVVLTVAHLDHQPENCDDDNLRAMCQRCHLAYDRDHHRSTRRGRKAIGDLFDERT